MFSAFLTMLAEAARCDFLNYQIPAKIHHCANRRNWDEIQKRVSLRKRYPTGIFFAHSYMRKPYSAPNAAGKSGKDQDACWVEMSSNVWLEYDWIKSNS